MFHLHDRTRRRIALAVFFALGLMPTLAVSAWGVWWRSARHVDREAEQMGLRLGMNISLTGVRHPEPGMVAYENLQACEPEGRQPVFRCRELRACWNASSEGGSTRGLRLVLSQPEISASQWAEIWSLVDRVLTRRMEAGDAPLHFAAEELGVVGRESSQKLAQVDVRVDSRPTGAQIEATFRLAGNTKSDPVRLLVTRNREVTPPATGIELDTGGVPVSCHLLATALPGFELLGPRSSFRGAFRASLSDEGPTGELVGQFTDVDLERLVSDHSPHQMSGAAGLSVETARFARGRLEEAAGSLVGGPGMIGRPLLELAVQRLGMARGIEFDRADRLLPYEQVAVLFACDAKGLRVQGLCPGRTSGTVLAGRTGAILSEPQPPNLRLPLATVVEALAPEAEQLIPIARQNDWLRRRLPIVPPVTQPEVENPLR